jgi:hypothetical protein
MSALQHREVLRIDWGIQVLYLLIQIRNPQSAIRNSRPRHRRREDAD